ncbi:hypothetical protein [Ornithinibacillus sp. JPR2-1]|uniref:hypothetical protein n=1 Tax=Ornithinibacillus sp. JPR2-1 TaxID=2094019 RepID=UPI0031E2AE47
MYNNLDPVIKEELNKFIQGNLITDRVKSLNIDRNSSNSNEPTVCFGHSFGNFSTELDIRVRKVENAQTLGDYIEDLYQEKRKEDPND